MPTHDVGLILILALAGLQLDQKSEVRHFFHGCIRCIEYDNIAQLQLADFQWRLMMLV